jgi:hypothetical protein
LRNEKNKEKKLTSFDGPALRSELGREELVGCGLKGREGGKRHWEREKLVGCLS